MMRRCVPFAGLCAAAVLALAGCGGSDEAEQAAAGPSGAPIATTGTLAPAAQGGAALSYDPAAAPPGARLALDVTPGEGTTTAVFRVEGMVPNRGYAVHAHARPCGPTGDAAGPHYQNEQDPAATPESPSVDPAYANPQNEFWLDLTTDAAGAGQATATVPFGFTDRAPQSVIVHEAMMTMTAPGEAGTAGGRVACLTGSFR